MKGGQDMGKHNGIDFATDVNWAGTFLDPALDPPRNVALRDARSDARVHAQAVSGGQCRCCGQFVKVYRRTITSSMGLALLYVYNYFDSRGWIAGDSLHVAVYLAAQRADPRITAGWHGGDWAKLRYWNLIEPVPGLRDDGSTRAGLYTITALGRAFAERAATVPKYVYLYAQMFLGNNGPPVSIDDVLGERFHYNDLMAGDAPALVE